MSDVFSDSICVEHSFWNGEKKKGCNPDSSDFTLFNAIALSVFVLIKRSKVVNSVIDFRLAYFIYAIKYAFISFAPTLQHGTFYVHDLIEGILKRPEGTPEGLKQYVSVLLAWNEQ